MMNSYIVCSLFLSVWLVSLLPAVGSAPIIVLPKIETACWDEKLPLAVNLTLAQTIQEFDLEIYELRLDSMQLKELGFEDKNPGEYLNKQVVLKDLFDQQRGEILVALRSKGSIISLQWLK